MQIQRSPQGGVPRRLPLNAPQGPTPTPPPPGEHHHHGLTGALLHVGHDAAMLAMTPVSGQHQHGAAGVDDLAMGTICRGGGSSAVPADPHAGHHNHPASGPSDPHAGHHHPGESAPVDPQAGHHHHHGGSTDWLATGSAVVSGLVAVGAAVHGLGMITSKDRFTQLEGANHLLMSASCGVMAGAMLAPQSGLGAYSTPLMAAHGLGEVALGAYQLVKGSREDCQHHQLAGALKIAHGGCLAAAQFFPGAAFPLYLGMAAVTASQISLQQAGLSL